MKENLSIKVNLTKIPGAALVDIKGNTSTKKCIVIPIEGSNLFVGEKGVYLNMTAIALKEPKYDDTHLVKQAIEKEKYNAMSKEQQDAIPIIGGIRTMEKKVTEMETSGTAEYVPGDGNDLPF
ncbi:MAG TPA: hypothetical protein VK152_00265 [Paludibacter sp.]|nr:hypothetical protein [Paludibacter sp.]